jgi:hypothetical protein
MFSPIKNWQMESAVWQGTLTQHPTVQKFLQFFLSNALSHGARLLSKMVN